MSEPLRFAFEVACPKDHAFATWTERMGTWWPADHTVSGAPEAVVFERRVGGRIYERTRAGDEHVWGEVTAFDPPDHLAFHWHLGVGPELVTEVGITFSALGDSATLIDIEQTGFERLGVVGSEHRARNRIGWESLAPRIRAAAEKGA